MTRPRRDIAESLSRRGLTERWATEEEAAARSGMTPDAFKDQLPALEAKGFPRKNRWNNLRFIPTIDAFWDREDAAEQSKPLPGKLESVQTTIEQREAPDREPRKRYGIRHAAAE